MDAKAELDTLRARVLDLERRLEVVEQGWCGAECFGAVCRRPAGHVGAHHGERANGAVTW